MTIDNAKLEEWRKLHAFSGYGKSKRRLTDEEAEKLKAYATARTASYAAYRAWEQSSPRAPSPPDDGFELSDLRAFACRLMLDGVPPRDIAQLVDLSPEGIRMWPRAVCLEAVPALLAEVERLTLSPGRPVGSGGRHPGIVPVDVVSALEVDVKRQRVRAEKAERALRDEVERLTRERDALDSAYRAVWAALKGEPVPPGQATAGRVASLRSLLREVEWKGVSLGSTEDSDGRLRTTVECEDMCHFCANRERDGHAPDCRLAAALKEG